MASSLIALRKLLAGLLLSGVSASALAASLSISPVVVKLDEKTRTAAITLKNEGSESRVIQTELLRWTQKDGENIHAPTRDLLVNPPIATLQPGHTQIIRIGLNRLVDKEQELAYRLYISEVPPPPKEGFTGLRIALRLGVAVFVAPKAVDKLDWRAMRTRQGALKMTLHNNGNHHTRVSNLKVLDPGSGQQLAEWQAAPTILLSGQTYEYSMQLPAGWQGSQLSLVATTNDGPVEAKVELEQAAQ
jgi:fimbrial chaperone protein